MKKLILIIAAAALVGCGGGGGGYQGRNYGGGYVAPGNIGNIMDTWRPVPILPGPGYSQPGGPLNPIQVQVQQPSYFEQSRQNYGIGGY